MDHPNYPIKNQKVTRFWDTEEDFTEWLAEDRDVSGIGDRSEFICDIEGRLGVYFYRFENEIDIADGDHRLDNLAIAYTGEGFRPVIFEAHFDSSHDKHLGKIYKYPTAFVDEGGIDHPISDGAVSDIPLVVWLTHDASNHPSITRSVKRLDDESSFDYVLAEVSVDESEPSLELDIVYEPGVWEAQVTTKGKADWSYHKFWTGVDYWVQQKDNIEISDRPNLDGTTLKLGDLTDKGVDLRFRLKPSNDEYKCFVEFDDEYHPAFGEENSLRGTIGSNTKGGTSFGDVYSVSPEKGDSDKPRMYIECDSYASLDTQGEREAAQEWFAEIGDILAMWLNDDERKYWKDK